MGELPPQTAKRISDSIKIQGGTMIKEWATVVSWHNGVAQVHCDVKAPPAAQLPPVPAVVAGC